MTDDTIDPVEGAPENGTEAGTWNVRIIDLSGATEGEDDTVEVVKDFIDLMHANAYARAYVRDSIERCRTPGASSKEVIENWLAFGENAEVVDAGEDGWKSSTELEDFAASRATPMERDWRAIDPRRLVDDEEINGPPDEDDDEDDENRHEVIRH
ncbi:hypothetical protein A0U94_02945 [Gluconobacter albidus]|uniref:Uncharacterized protein n=1 Tax=Gluconobacter albidus TaxID=318683 RepID=A0AAW3QUF2_9PROT|nr:hypothetical protein [Gluconobacter albidus]AQS90093.1 hypothetical protein A0U94_02945 [Gluconobacter albidus]KXV36623.1 hypothetical protein AD941_14915 [Gluconobacter albidus]GBQ91634.1 hypothetical protein AA3250_2330 [Gluconobacter albidus NBRC 3250]GLQ68378.1 hypothetical protein GCM10007866_08260 [Gluconobacter albidus]